MHRFAFHSFLAYLAMSQQRLLELSYLVKRYLEAYSDQADVSANNGTTTMQRHSSLTEKSFICLAVSHPNLASKINAKLSTCKNRATAWRRISMENPNCSAWVDEVPTLVIGIATASGKCGHKMDAALTALFSVSRTHT